MPYSRRIDKPDDENLHGQRVRRVRVLWNVDEMSGFLSKATRNGSSLEQTIMQLYDCPPVMQQILAREVRFASEPFGCFLSTTQPAAIGKYLNMQHVVTGFLNRWMPVFGTPKPRQWLDRASINFAPPVASYNGVWNGWARRERAVAWERAAALGWERFALSEIEPMLSDDEDDAYSNIYSRIELLLRKLMLCFCINEQCDTITPDILRRVLEMYPYIKACYDKLTGRVADDDLSRCMDRIIAGLHQHDGVITQSTLTKWLDNWKKTFPRQMSAQALEILTKTGVIAIEKQMPEKGKTGRPATLVRLTG